MNSTSNAKSIEQIISEVKQKLHKGGQCTIDVLRDCFVGIPALVVSAGPSAVHWHNVAGDLSKPLLIVTVKQAVDGHSDLSGRTHIHFANVFNLKKYCYDRTRVLSFMTNSDPPAALFQPWDVHYTLRRRQDPINDNIAKSQHFDKWTLDQSGLIRPLGPGIMYESVIYTLIHMGVKQISTIGWDIASSEGLNNHFDDKGLFADKARLKRNHNQYLRKLKILNMLSLGELYAYYKHMRGQKYNLIMIHEWEPPLLSASLLPFVNWLKSMGVEIRCYTDSAWFPNEVAIRLAKLSSAPASGVTREDQPRRSRG
jgi:hypothetical protein